MTDTNVKGLAYGPIKSKHDISSTSIVVWHTLLKYASVNEGESTDSTYAQFFFHVPSMKKLEDCIEKKHVISFLSGQGLPPTH